jgi:hypothetical protein
MIKRLLAITFIFICTAVAWGILAATIFNRTYNSGRTLRGKVESAWGSSQKQSPPFLRFKTKGADGKDEYHYLRPAKSDIEVKLALDHRQKGLLWYNTYRVAFHGTYEFTNFSPLAGEATLHFPLPAAKSVYDDLRVTQNGQVVEISGLDEDVLAKLAASPGEVVRVEVAYGSQGLDRWEHAFAKGAGEAKDFRLRVTTNFDKPDFPENSLPPVTKKKTKDGWELEWKYARLVSGVPVAVVMPGKLQPGPLAGEISTFAPVSLFFFFFVMLLITTMKNIDLHPMHYFFIAAAFFAFHLLLAYLVDHVSIHVAFVICSVVSIGLVVSYLRLVVGGRFALVEAGLAQLVYLVLFSYAFFFEGYTGLTVTIGAIVTLFVAMQLTARVNWSEKFRGVGKSPA